MRLFKTEGTILDKSFRAQHPSWKKQLLLFFVLMMTLFFGLQVVTDYFERNIDYGKELILGSKRSRMIKDQLTPLAARLEAAQKVGDHQAVMALFVPVTKIVEDFNALDEDAREKINASPLRYCVLASLHLGDGIREVLKSGYWLKKDQYQNALDMCK